MSPLHFPLQLIHILKINYFKSNNLSVWTHNSLNGTSQGEEGSEGKSSVGLGCWITESSTGG